MRVKPYEGFSSARYAFYCADTHEQGPRRMNDLNIEDRIRRLEDIEAIRALKARYLACCDAKDPDGVRACFADGPITIEYGPIGSFETADDLVAVYTEIACHEHMVEMHHGVNPRIELTGGDSAHGRWNVHYQLINTRDMTLTQLAGEYRDEYRRTPAGWRISATRFAVTSALSVTLGEDALKLLLASNQPPDLAA